MRLFYFIIALFLSLNAYADNVMNLRSYGDDSPNKMYLFTSLACPHCAHFHQDVLPEIEKKYLKNQRAKIIVVDMYMNNNALMGAMLLRCVAKDKAHKMEEELYQKRKEWVYDEENGRSYLAEIAMKYGMSAGDFETCIQNKDLQKTIITDQKRLSATYGVTHMPTLVYRQGERVFSWTGTDKDEIMSGLSEAIQ